MRTLSILVFAVLGSTAYADTGHSIDPAERENCQEQQRTGPATFHVETINGKQTWVTDDPIIICGHRHRPAVAIIDAPRAIAYRWLDLEQGFLPKIFATLKQTPMQ